MKLRRIRQARLAKDRVAEVKETSRHVSGLIESMWVDYMGPDGDERQNHPTFAYYELFERAVLTAMVNDWVPGHFGPGGLESLLDWGKRPDQSESGEVAS
jgi:hypothetical protein